MISSIRILAVFLIILSSGCHAYFETVYELNTKQEQFFESKDFENYWDLCLSNSTKNRYDNIANSMSKSDNKYYPFYKYMDNLVCVDAEKMKGKDLFIFCLDKSISLVEYLQKGDVKGTSGNVEKIGDFTAFRFISKDSCLTYQIENNNLPDNNGLLIKEGKGWKLSDRNDPENNVVKGFIALFSDPKLLKKFPLCQDDFSEN